MANQKFDGMPLQGGDETVKSAAKLFISFKIREININLQ